MSKLLLSLTLISLMVLTLGTALWPNSSAFWLASNVASYQHIREILMGVILLQVITKPPRNVIFRLLAGSTAALICYWAICSTYSSQMQILDTLSFIGAAITILVSALEGKAVRKIDLSNNQADA